MSLGPPIRPPVEPEPEWKTYEPNPALEVNRQGQLRTKPVPLPIPPVPIVPIVRIWVQGKLLDSKPASTGIEDGQAEDWMGACW